MYHTTVRGSGVAMTAGASFDEGVGGGWRGAGHATLTGASSGGTRDTLSNDNRSHTAERKQKSCEVETSWRQDGATDDVAASQAWWLSKGVFD